MIFSQDDGSIYVVVGDAIGHLSNAGMMVSITKLDCMPQTFKAIINNKSLESNLIKSIDLGTTRMLPKYDKNCDDSLVFTSAGMPPAIYLITENLSIEELLVPGLPLGSMKT